MCVAVESDMTSITDHAIVQKTLASPALCPLSTREPRTLLLTFKKPDGTSITLGPLRQFRFDAEELREAEGAQLLARHEGRAWNVAGAHFLRLDYEGPLTVTFEDSSRGRTSRAHGPFTHFSSVDGVTYANHEVFCHLNDKTRLWHFREDHTEWPTLIVRKA
jgi:hypothetical protein